MEEIQNIFNNYIRRYDVEDENNKIRIQHSINVMNISEELTKSLDMNEIDIRIAKIIGLFHDIGRFMQYTEYKTYNDYKSEDHAYLGVDVIERYRLLENVVDSETLRYIIETAIVEHNKYQINPNLTSNVKQFCKILRDADKLDILNEQYLYFDKSKEKRQSIEQAELKKEIVDLVKEHKLINKKSLGDISELESIIINLCYIYDLNYKKSFEILKENNYIDKIIDSFNYRKSSTNKKMQTIKKELDKYIDEKLK